MEHEQKPCKQCGEQMIKQELSAVGLVTMANGQQIPVVSVEWYKCQNGHPRYFMDGEIRASEDTATINA